MKNINLYLLSVLMLLCSAIGGEVRAQSYCASAGGDGEDIVNVRIGTLNNSSTCNQTGGAGSVLNQYSNYTDLPAPVLPRLNPIPFSIGVGYCTAYGQTSTSIWIDYNHNGSFDAPDERVYNSPFFTEANYTINDTIFIPTSALKGPTRMRVITVRYGSLPHASACGNHEGGETEDYTVNITEPAYCSGAPAPGNTIASKTVVCPTETIDLSFSSSSALNGIDAMGFTYQWFNNAGAIPGATSPTYATKISAADNFRCEVTCTYSGQKAQSTPVAISMTPIADCYCKPTATIPDGLDIFNVTVGTLNHSTTISETGGPGSVLNKYSDFTTTVTAPALNQLATIPFSIKVGGNEYNSQTAMWIDYNHDGVFQTPEEQVHQTTGSNTGDYTTTGSFTIPKSALLGITRLRVINSFGPFLLTSACSNYYEGEAEDYLVNIVEAPACSGSPIQTQTIATQHPVCPEAKYTFSLSPLITTSGNTYQWYNDAGLIAGATNDTYTTTITADDNFYCKVTCPNGTKTTTSTPVAAYKCFCTSMATSTNGSDIFNVTVGTLNNTTDISQTGGPGSVLNSYSNFTGTVAAPVLNQLATISFSVQIGRSITANQTSIWIDYNHNGSFDDPGERVHQTTGYNFGNYTTSGSFLVPITALKGITRMRVITSVSTTPLNSACDEYFEGETEDYIVNIVAPPACSGPPVQTNTIATQHPTCPETKYTFSLSPLITTSGNTYQWYNDAGLIPGATNDTYTTPLTNPDSFYCEVTCPNGTRTTTSTPVTVLPCYCTSMANNGNENISTDIHNVTAGTLNHSSDGTQTGGPGSQLGRYSDYTNLVAAPAFNQLATIPFSVKISSPDYTQTSIWIDFNRNSTFEPNERVYQSTGLNFGSYTQNGSFLIPETALPGITRMRVITSYGLNPVNSACENYEYGETEDYNVNIIEPLACSGTPIQTTTIATQNQVCPDVSFTFSLSPLITTSENTYQWYNSAGAIAGANDKTYTATITNADSFYCIVTCPNGAKTSTSTPVAVQDPYLYCSCSSTATSSGSEDIFNVTVGTLNNSSDCNQTGGPGSTRNRYSDYTSVVTAPDLELLTAIPFAVTTTGCGGYGATTVSIWIDLNHNGVFDAPGERVYNSERSIFELSHTQSGSFIIPSGSLLGLARMRVISARDELGIPMPSACGDYSQGETEDYFVNILPPPACSGSPIQTTTIATQQQVCPEATYTFSISPEIQTSGNTYQWYNDAGLIPGATSETYTATITKTDHFYCKVSCPNGDKTTASTPVTVFACYCTSMATGTASMEILNVTAGTLNNATTRSQTGGPGSVLGSYSDFTTLVAAPEFNQLAPVPFSISVGASDYYTQVSVWIDYDQNGTFESPGELVYQSTGYNLRSYTVSNSFTIPVTALTGLTRMRIVNSYGLDPVASACENYSEGETEDYLVNIVAPAVCSGSPIQATTVATQNPDSPEINFTFSLTPSITTTGNTYQWYNDAGAIAGATNETYTTTITKADNFYCEVTCPNGNATTASTPVAVLAPYLYSSCFSGPADPNYEKIFNVTVGTLNNTSDCDQTGGPGSVLKKYSDYTTLVAAPDLPLAGTVPFSVMISACNAYGPMATSIWIDFNHNGMFDAPNERVFSSPSYPLRPAYTESGSFNIPANALPGLARMRVITSRDGALPMTSACGEYVKGETEDYFVNIVVPACSGAPAAGNTMASQNNVCAGTSVTLSLSSEATIVTGLTFQWFKNGVAISDATHATYTTVATITEDFYCEVTCTGSAQSSPSTPVKVTVSPVSLPTSATTHTQNVAATPLVADDCQYIAKIVPIAGFTEATIKSWKETTPPFKYVPRHYEITPATNPNSASGTVTLYFSQADFNAYNSTITTGLLPTGPTAAAGIANFQILKYAGTSPTGLGYAGFPTFIPGSPNAWNTGAYTFVWNATNSIWEVTFPVTGFSGFLAKSVEQPLPVTLISFTGKVVEKHNELAWKTSSEINFSHFEIQRSLNATTFEKIGSHAPEESGSYTFLDSDPPQGKAYYRLKMIDLDTKYSFSKIIALENNAARSLVGHFYPNPGTGKVFIEINAIKKGPWKISNYDLTGRLLSYKSKVLQAGLNIITIDKLLPGLNIFKFEDGTTSEVRKVVKE